MSSEKDILALQDRRFAAAVEEDFKALEAMVHDELVYTHSHGGGDTKASWIDAMRSRKTRYRRIVPGERKARVYGDAALITGRVDFEVESSGQPRSLRLVFLEAWTKTPQGWKFVAWQSTPRPA
ncbi:MAG: nuclear transport factor 2 family protein [Betaproteobacteria bacterium]